MNDDDRQYWFNLMTLTPDQIQQLSDILEKERLKLLEIDRKFGPKSETQDRKRVLPSIPSKHDSPPLRRVPILLEGDSLDRPRVAAVAGTYQDKNELTIERQTAGTPIEEILALLPPSGLSNMEQVILQYREFVDSDRELSYFEKNHGFIQMGAGGHGKTMGQLRRVFVDNVTKRMGGGSVSEADIREIAANNFNAIFAANLYLASKEAPQAERGDYVSVGLFGLAIFENNPINKKSRFLYDGLTQQLKPDVMRLYDGYERIQVRSGSAFGQLLADISAGRREFNASAGIDALGSDIDYVVREHPAEVALTIAALTAAFSDLDKGFSNGRLNHVVPVRFQLGESGHFDSSGQTGLKVVIKPLRDVRVTNNGGTSIFVSPVGNSGSVAGEYEFSIDYRQHRLVKEGYNGSFTGAFTLPSSTSKGYTVRISLDSRKVRLVENP